MNSVMTIVQLLDAYQSNELAPEAYLRQRLELARADRTHSWIELISDEQLTTYLHLLQGQSPQTLPLFGIPFAIKDNIDLAELPTTAGCPDYRFQPQQSAFVVQQLMAAGAIPLGKTNLDQFATGLVGTRSPWGAVKNSFNPEYIAGGSSSGSAVTVATGQVCFSLGTDTAGSGRVPAAFNNILGLKASKGRLSCSGVVPACKSLDCVTLFAHTSDDLSLLLAIAGQYDANDCYARKAPCDLNHAYQPEQALQGKKIGVPLPEQLNFFGNAETEQLFSQALTRLQELGAELVVLDFKPFLEAALLLYQGPWVAERYAAIEAFFQQDPSRCLPVIETIMGGANEKTAVDTFKAMYQLQAFKVQSDAALAQVDAMVTPTAGTIYTIAQVENDPIQLNSNLGYYTNFMNLLDYAAIAVPAGFQTTGLPFGLTFFGPAWSDALLLSLGGCWQQALGFTLGASETPLPPATRQESGEALWVDLAVCGAHLTGLPLNPQLTNRGARKKKNAKTSANYRFYALAGGPPHRPGLIRNAAQGCAIEVEIWQIPADQLGRFLLAIPPPLGLGKVELEDGSWVTSFICEGYAIEHATDISHFGSWRRYLERNKS